MRKPCPCGKSCKKDEDVQESREPLQWPDVLVQESENCRLSQNRILTARGRAGSLGVPAAAVP